MSPRAILRHAGETAPVDLNDLDEEIRRGRLPGAAELQHGPWTGDAFKRLTEIPQLAEALDAPGARLADHLRLPPRPVASSLVTGLVASIGLAHLLWPGLYALSPTLGGPLMWLDQHGATGYEPLLLDDRWWSPWTSQLLHGGPMHLFPNLAVVGYGGLRVEQALGASGYLTVAAAAVLGGALGMALTSNSSVIGSSLIGYGLLGALLTIGFRFGDGLPPRSRRYYGFGNLGLFAFLFISGLQSPNAAHAGHAGGLLGGVLAAALLAPESAVSRALKRAVRRRNLGIAGALAALPGLIGLGVARSPRLALGALQPVTLDDDAASLQIPQRLLPAEDASGETEPLPYNQRVDGLPSWSTSPSSSEALYVGLSRLRSDASDPLSGEAFAARWARRAGGEWSVAEPPPPLGEDWTAQALEGRAGPDGALWRVVEHQRRQGLWLHRAGYLVAGVDGPRERAFAQALTTLTVGEPPDLAEAREAHERSPRSPRLSLELARQLYAAGQYREADPLFEDLIARDLRRSEALDWRIEMWGEQPSSFPPPGDGPPWFEAWLVERPSREEWQRAGLRWYLHHRLCAPARAIVERSGLASADLKGCAPTDVPVE